MEYSDQNLLGERTFSQNKYNWSKGKKSASNIFAVANKNVNNVSTCAT